MINTDNIEKAKRLIKDCKEKPLVVNAQDDFFNRKILEYGKFDILQSVEKGTRKDSLRQLDSGFNHVLANISAKNKVAFGIDINEIENLSKKEKSERIARLIQNIIICRKVGVKIIALNYKDKKDAFSFLLGIGASSIQAKEAISF